MGWWHQRTDLEMLLLLSHSSTESGFDAKVTLDSTGYRDPLSGVETVA